VFGRARNWKKAYLGSTNTSSKVGPKYNTNLHQGARYLDHGIGCFLRGKRLNLIIMERNKLAPRKGFTANSYIDILEDQLLTIY